MRQPAADLMLHDAILLKPSASFWEEAASAVLEAADSQAWLATGQAQPSDLSFLRVVVPAHVHGSLLKSALAARIARPFVPPRISTLDAWLDLQPFDPEQAFPHADSVRTMTLYGQLRQHAWLKKLFSAKRNTDLLPLAQTLLTLSDELTEALLPASNAEPGAADELWEAALSRLPPSARELLSDEAQLVWSIWKSQLDANDPCVIRFECMKRLAARAKEPLIWISPAAPDPFHQAFLDAYAQRQPVLPVRLDWRPGCTHAAFETAWKEMCDPGDAPSPVPAGTLSTPAALALMPASGLEDEAQCGARTILAWLAAGKTQVAIVAQDRVVARRMRALLERAQIFVADETGWKLSTTRAAAALAAWFDVVSSRADTVALLDLLKSPYASQPFGMAVDVMAIETALRSENVQGGWEAASAALRARPDDHAVLLRLAQLAGRFAERRTLAGWVALTREALDALGMLAALECDEAGLQLLQMLDKAAEDCAELEERFSFSEWSAFVGLQVEATIFHPAEIDKRVVMLPLNGARLRSFDAVLLAGADADHLPSRPNETLFFANAVRSELGLATRESRQRQQLRDLAELLSSNPEVVLSWQSVRNGEPVPVSPWIERLELTLERAGAALPPRIRPPAVEVRLRPAPPSRPAPSAQQLLPEKLSASGYNSFVACPYQFFAERMLRLAAMDELSDMPAKRDYGDWLHRILAEFHETLERETVAADAREALLRAISERVFGEAIERNAAALAFQARWNKTMPAYLSWAGEREQAGWRFVFGERWMQTTLDWEGGSITLHGRIDRIDEDSDGDRAVLDYKTTSVDILKRRLKEGEDHQLAFYGLLSDAPSYTASYVALEPARDKIGAAEAENYAIWQGQLRVRIVDGMRAIAQGAPLPAHGIESVCRYCGVRGLCRKGAW